MTKKTSEKNNKNNFFDIAIIGSSFVGMTAALKIAQISDQLKIAVIEKSDLVNSKKKADGKAFAISANSLKIFKKIDIFNHLQQFAGDIREIKIIDQDLPIILNFSIDDEDKKDIENQTSQLGQIIESHHIFNILREKILAQKNITIFDDQSFKNIENKKTEDGEVVEIETDKNEKIICFLALACDGRYSEVRDYFKVDFSKKNYQQTAIVFNVAHQKKHQNIAYEKFYTGGPLAILPMQDQHQSSIVYIVKGDLAEVFLTMDEENFINQIKQKTEEILGEISLTSEKFSYPLNLFQAKKFFSGKVILVGDSSTAIHPIAGQGFNLGIKGVEILTNLIERNHQSFTPINSDLMIEEYNKMAGFNAKKMAIATDLLNKIFESNSLALKISRNIGLAMMNKSKMLKNIFIKNAGGF
jgi:2-octaprenyl-6-methoxyphenol hydroxylase